MKVLVTGGFGTIGSCLSSKLFKSGHQVTIFDNEEIGKSDNLLLYLTQDELKEINLIFSDILDHDSLSAAIKEVDICFHMAATLGTLNVVQQPSRMLNVNIIGTQNVVMECVKKDIPKGAIPPMTLITISSPLIQQFILDHIDIIKAKID